MEALQENKGTKMFIDGKGGTGNTLSTHITNIKTIISPAKTTLARKIMTSTRISSLGSASTALAATLYNDFETTHSLFKFPVVEDEDKEPNVPTKCELHRNPKRVEFLRAADLFILDEFPYWTGKSSRQRTERW